MKNIYGNDGPVIFADDGKFEVIGQVGNEIFYKGGSIKVTGNIGSSIDGKVEGDEPGPVPPGPGPEPAIDPLTFRMVVTGTERAKFASALKAAVLVDSDDSSDTYDVPCTVDSSGILTVPRMPQGDSHLNADYDVEIIAQGDFSEVVSCNRLFEYFLRLKKCCELTFSNCTIMRGVFNSCENIEYLPIVKVADGCAIGTFLNSQRPAWGDWDEDCNTGCPKIKSGVKEAYEWFISHNCVPDSRYGKYNFTNAGYNIEQRKVIEESTYAELNNIPQSWGGKAEG